MGFFGYLLGKSFLVVATVGQLVVGTMILPVCPPASALLIDGAAASAAMLASPVDPVSTATAVLTTAI